MVTAGPSCPLCSSTRRTAIPPSPCYRCASCGAVYNEGYHPLVYDDDYFIGEYRTQYGKTYEEDFGAIYAAGRRRLESIFRLLPDAERGAVRLLDIGCALGFFLTAARDAGIGTVEGIEISAYAADYARTHVSCTIHQAPFGTIPIDGPFDIITAWYFIEHCENPRDAIGDVTTLLAPGGVFAFAAPSAFGPLFHFDRTRWIETHPADHRVDFTPRAARRLLARSGYRTVTTVAGACHPERIMSPHAFGYRAFASLYGAVSRRLSFSDTLEVYARKRG